jgi:hypothetical protein
VIRARPFAAALLLLLPAAAARAEEGLWTINDFPRARVKASHGFAPDDAWLDRVRASTVIMGTCSGAFVSPDGLALLHRDCVTSCLAMRASLKRTQSFFGEACRDRALRKGLPLFDLLYCAPLDREEQRLSDTAGFVAATPAEEVVCTNRALRQLVSIQDVTERMKQALDRAGKSEVFEAWRAAAHKIERECGQSDRVECQVAALYDGARFELHKYKYFRDVRLVFQPERNVSTFGLEGPALTFPQYRFSPALVRVYEDGKPARTPFLPLAEASPREGDLVFLSGYQRSTQRRNSVASLQLTREWNSYWVPFQAEVRGLLHEYGKHKLDPAQAAAMDVSNDQGVFRVRALLDALTPTLIARREADEKALRAKVDQDPKLRQRYGKAWETEGRILQEYFENHRRDTMVETAGCGPLYYTARDLVRAPDERGKPDSERLSYFTEARLPSLERDLLRPIAFDRDLQTEIVAFCFRVFQQEAGFRDPLVKKILQGRSPDEAAREMVHHTRLADLSVRKALWQGGRAAVQASTDPFIAMWRRIDGDVRALRKRYEAEIGSPLTEADRQIGQARFEVFGTSEYPDAAETLRLRFGKVASTTAQGRTVAAFVSLSEMFGLATGHPPYELPARWTDAKAGLDLTMPLSFTTDTDVVLGNGQEDLGGPMINKDLTVAGMVTGGNEAVAGSVFDFRAETARAVVLNSAALLHVLEQIYRADALVRELRAAPRPGK